MNIVTGMHRSGTSFLANLLYQAGCDFGDHSRLLSADDFNARGYFENIDVMLLNDKIVLGEVGYSETARLLPRGSHTAPIGRLSLSLLKARYLFLNSLEGVQRRGTARLEDIERIGSSLGSTWVKDPRFSLTLGLWQQAGRVQKLVYSFRHPLEVARSLKQREGLPLWLGLRTWVFHVEAFLQQAKDQETVLIDFNRLRSAEHREQELGRLASAMGSPQAGELLQQALANVLDPELVHHREQDEAGLSVRAEQTYRTLQALHRSQP